MVPARMMPQRTQFVTFVHGDMCVALPGMRAAQTSDSAERLAAMIPAVPHDAVGWENPPWQPVIDTLGAGAVDLHGRTPTGLPSLLAYGPCDIEDLGPDRDTLTWGTRGRGLHERPPVRPAAERRRAVAPPANAPLPPPPPPPSTLLSFAGAQW